MTDLNYIAGSAVVSRSARIGRFCVIEADVILGDEVVVEDFALIQAGSSVGARTRIGTYCKVGKSVVIGEDCGFTSYCEIRDNCRLGNRVSMGSRCTLSANTIVEDDAIMKYAFVVTDTPVLGRNAEKRVGKIGRGARFGANVTIMPGVTIGANAEIGACSQVRHDVPDNEVWFGNPAKYFRNA